MNKLINIFFGVLTTFRVNLVGNIFLSELLSVFILPFINFKNFFKKNAKIATLIRLLFVFLFAQILSDITNSSASNDYLRGWALILFSTLSLVIYIYLGRKNHLFFIHYLFGLLLVKIFLGEQNIILENHNLNDNYFKIRFVPFLNPLILILSYYLFKLEKYFTSIIIVFIYSLVCFYFSARSNGLVYFLSGFLLLMKIKRIKISIISFFIVVSIIYVSYVFYVNKVLSGELTSSNSKNQLELVDNPYNPFELIYYGRIDNAVLIEAIKDKPLFGHGSWGKDKNNKYADLHSQLSKTNREFEFGYIRAHSILLGAWAYSGIIGFLSVMLIFYKLFKLNYILYKNKLITPFFVVIVILGVDMFWHFLFSPLGLLRTTFPLYGAIIIVEYNKLLKKV